MNLKRTTERAGYFTGSAGVVIVAGVLVSVITGLQQDRDRYRAEAGQRPGPAATTVTARPPAAAVSSSPRARASGSSPPGTGTAPGTVTVAEHRDSPVGRAPRAVGPPSVPSPAPSSPPRATPSGPSPTARPPATSQQCGSSGQVLAVRLLKACVSIGGSQ